MQFPLRRLGRFGVALGLIASAILAPASAASAAQTLNLSAGAESVGGDVQLNEFAPNQVTINVGDTITWRLDSTEFHNVTFPGGGPPPDFIQAGADGVFINPASAFPSGGPNFDGTALAGSGLLNKGDTYSLTFTKAGDYNYLCTIHAGMTGTVKVASGQADTQATVDTRRTAQVNGELATKAIPAIMANRGELATPTATIGVAAGVQNGPADSLRFLPERVTIHQGDSVSWIWRTHETPHTVTFLAGQPAPDVVIPEPQGSGPPRLKLNPAVLAPAGSAIDWNGGTLLHSGFQQPMPGRPAPEFGVHFSTAGTYDYVCLLHEGMRGTVVVLPNED
jgi:plastocyanin